LTADKVRTIRALHAQGWTRAALARQYDVSWDTVESVLNGRTWRAV
jgi:lambda repressor-like predicted transcriptional regulator